MTNKDRTELAQSTMDVALAVRAEEGLLYATLSGAFSLEEAQRTFLQILASLEQHKLRKVVVDGRPLTGEPSPAERYLYGEFVAKEVGEQCSRMKWNHPQFAYLLIPPVGDPQRLGENAAVNRGMFVKTFENLNDALKWLGIDSAGGARY
jgi:hypothetical protein